MDCSVRLQIIIPMVQAKQIQNRIRQKAENIGLKLSPSKFWRSQFKCNQTIWTSWDVLRIDAMQSVNASVFILRENLFRSEKERLKNERNA